MEGIESKRVLVTAGGRNIGRAIAARFADLGARVHICDVDQAALADLAASHPALKGLRADVSDEAQVARLFETVLAAEGGLDVLVNNAGISGPTGYLEDMSYADWRHCLAVNLDGGFLCLRQAIPAMKRQGQGCVINITSTAGHLSYPLRTPYASAKWAVVGLTKSLAAELGPFGIRVNAVAPGSVESERMSGVIVREAAARGVAAEQVREGYLKQSALGTFIDPEDIAEAVVFLASDHGAKISGQVLPVDGHVETLAT
jgi:NAD(P)-dependent dehydrogenase (short-subunit alcohol dehydrogenase family)